MPDTIQQCEDLTLIQAWRKLGELNDINFSTVAYDQVPASLLPDLKSFVVGQTQSGEVPENAVDRALYVNWLLKIFYRGFDYQIRFKTDIAYESVDRNP